MEKNRVKFISILVLIIVVGCTSNMEINLSFINKDLKVQKKNFGNDSNVNHLLSHFPEKVKDTVNLGFFFAPPGCPPSYECSAQFGEVYLMCGIDKTDGGILVDDILFKTMYGNDTNIIIDQIELRKGKFFIEKCNKAFSEKYPVPYFESFDFNLGLVQEEKTIEDKTYYRTFYSLPSDLEVFVIAAEAGDFWKVQCNENRPEALKEWKHGYSKGYATSEEKNLIVYWAMIW